ncbi:unnamed protein product [Alopecurus aequalis]
MPSASIIDPDQGVASAIVLDAAVADAAVVPSRPPTLRGRPEDFASFLRTQDKVDAICKEHGVPKEFTALLAGDLRANSTPPPGAICVCARALEAGMRVPLQGFFCQALAHFGIAPAQLTPNGWRFVVGFLGLCRSAGVPPSLAVFQHFFDLCSINKREKKGWYYFRSRDSSGLRFMGLPNPNSIFFKYWKHEFFFLSLPDPWPCPVEWGEPPKSSLKNAVLTGEEKKSAAKLLRAHGGAAVDLRPYLSNTNLAATLPPPSSTCPEVLGMDPSVYNMMKTMLAEKAAASVKKVKAEPSSDAPLSYGKKRSQQEATGEEGLLLSSLKAPLSPGVCSPLPGFSAKPQYFSSRLDRDTTGWESAREPQECVFTGNEPSYVYALELEEKLLAQERDAAALREQLDEARSEVASAKREAEQEKAKAELAAAGAELAKAKAGVAAAEAEVVKAKAELTAAAQRAADAAEQEKARPELAMRVAKAMANLAAAERALEEELDSAKVAAVHEFLCCEEHTRRRAERALEGYRRWRTGRAT